MEKQVNVYEAKSRFSKLLEQVEGGDEIVIARNGKPVARLVPLQRSAAPRELGSMRGKIWMAPDFDEPDDELIDLMENGPIFPDEADGL
ncbi:MAG: type II toxin-antitoxin system Phd/YefM family antitoxin [Pseudonocardiaceae bacterium]